MVRGICLPCLWCRRMFDLEGTLAAVARIKVHLWSARLCQHQWFLMFRRNLETNCSVQKSFWHIICFLIHICPWYRQQSLPTNRFFLVTSVQTDLKILLATNVFITSCTSGEPQFWERASQVGLLKSSFLIESCFSMNYASATARNFPHHPHVRKSSNTEYSQIQQEVSFE